MVKTQRYSIYNYIKQGKHWRIWNQRTLNIFDWWIYWYKIQVYYMQFYQYLTLNPLFFFSSSVLSRLIAVTDRVCDRGDGMVSPLYLAIHRDQDKSVEMLLREGYSPDAQDCTHILGLHSPLSFALSQTWNKPYRCVKALLTHSLSSRT